MSSQEQNLSRHRCPKCHDTGEVRTPDGQWTNQSCTCHWGIQRDAAIERRQRNVAAWGKPFVEDKPNDE